MIDTFAKAEITRLQECNTATLAGSFTFATQKQMEKALAAGLVECNTEITDGKAIAWKTTAAGIQFVAEMSGARAPNATPAQTGNENGVIVMGYEIGTLEDLSAFNKASKTGREGKYPFDALQPKQFFDVPATADNPTPWKSLQSTVSTASRRFATVTGTKTGKSGKALNEYEFERKFKVVRAKNAAGDDVARVARVI
jgi:hypothetical protein